jgi:hypothetical protein
LAKTTLKSLAAIHCIRSRWFIKSRAAFIAILATSCTSGPVRSQSLPAQAAPPQVLVTIYSEGPLWGGGFPRAKHNPFLGAIYEDDHLLVYLHPHRFITSSLPAGSHTFSASTSRHSAKNSQTTVTLSPGEHLYLRSQMETTYMGVLIMEKGRVDQVSCTDATQEASKTKPLEPKHIPVSKQPLFVPEGAFPAC